MERLKISTKNIKKVTTGGKYQKIQQGVAVYYKWWFVDAYRLIVANTLFSRP